MVDVPPTYTVFPGVRVSVSSTKLSANIMLGLKIVDMINTHAIIKAMPQGGKRMSFFFGLGPENSGRLPSNVVSLCDNLLLYGCIRGNPGTLLSGGVFVFSGNKL